MRAAVPKSLHPQASACRRIFLVAIALSLLGVALAHDASAEGKSTSGGATLALPKTSAEVAPFVAPMDDRQARSLLVRVLEERTRESEPMPEREMLTMMESATGRLAARVGQIFGAAGEVVTSPVLFWRWLTAGGSDPTGPWRALTGGFMLIGIGWLAQAAAAFAIRKTMPLRAGAEPRSEPRCRCRHTAALHGFPGRARRRACTVARGHACIAVNGSRRSH